MVCWAKRIAAISGADCEHYLLTFLLYAKKKSPSALGTKFQILFLLAKVCETRVVSVLFDCKISILHSFPFRMMVTTSLHVNLRSSLFFILIIVVIFWLEYSKSLDAK